MIRRNHIKNIQCINICTCIFKWQGFDEPLCQLALHLNLEKLKEKTKTKKQKQKRKTKQNKNKQNKNKHTTAAQ